MNDADRKIVERLKRFRQQDAVNLIESQATEIERLTTERDHYEGVLRAVCKVYKHDTTGYFTPEAEESA